MQYGRVCGTVVSTLKHPALAGHKMLLVQLFDLAGRPSGPKTLALDSVGAGADDWVLVVDEGSSASLVLENPRGPVRTIVVGIVDELHLPMTLRRAAHSGNPRRDKGLTAPGTPDTSF